MNNNETLYVYLGHFRDNLNSQLNPAGAAVIGVHKMYLIRSICMGVFVPVSKPDFSKF